MQEWLQEMFRYRNSQLKDSYQYDTNSCMMSIPPTWHKKDLNGNIHDDNMSIPSTYNKGISKHNMMNHDNKYITQMILHHIKQESWKQETRSLIKHQSGICVAQYIEKQVHEHTAYTSHLGLIWRKECQSAEVGHTINLAASNIMEWLLAHWMLTPALHFKKWSKNEMIKWEIWMHHQIYGIK